MNAVIKKDMLEMNISDIEKEKLKNSHFFITGANSSLAQYMVFYLLHLNEDENYNIKINVLVRNEEKAHDIYKEYIDQINFIVQDICTPITFDGKIDYIIHTAGSASPWFILNDPVGVINANTVGTLNVLNLAKDKNIKQLLFTSTREIYGQIPNNVDYITEDVVGSIDTLDSRSCYPESKRAAETLLKAFYNQYKVPFTIARIAHTYGPGMEIKNDGRIMADLISAAVNDEDIKLASDGTTMRGFCYITDTAAGMFKILLSGTITEAYNLSNETEYKEIKETAKLILKIKDNENLKLILNEDGQFKGGYTKGKFTQMSTKKLESLGWYPKVSLEDGIKSTIQYYTDKESK
ncbi:MAG: NAD-dependent epimerase/dehydratase family protein [bacterium]